MARNKTEKPGLIVGGTAAFTTTIQAPPRPEPIAWLGNSCPAKVALTHDGGQGFYLTSGPHNPVYINAINQYISPHGDDKDYRVRSRICLDCGSVYWETGINDD